MYYVVKFIDEDKWPHQEIAHYHVSNKNNLYEKLQTIIDRYRRDRNHHSMMPIKPAIILNPNEFNEIFDELISYLNLQNYDKNKPGNSEEKELIIGITKLKEENASLKLKVNSLEEENSKLGKKNLRQERDNLKQSVKQLNEKIKIKDKTIDRLYQDFNNLKQESQINSNELRTKYTNQYKQFNSQLRQYQNQLQENNNEVYQLKKDNGKLRNSKENLEIKNSSIEEKLKATEVNLGKAKARINELTLNPGMGGGGSRYDKLKSDFENLKWGEFYDTCTIVFKFWKEQDPQDPQLKSFRSQEFLKIKSILSERVFTDGMSYFAKDKSEVDTNVKKIMNELNFSVEDFSLTSSVSQVIEKKIEDILLNAKGIETSDETLEKHIDETTRIIQDDLEKIRNFTISDNVLQGIRGFVEKGLKLVQDIINDTSLGQFYTPEFDDNFDKNIHQPEGKAEGKVKFTVCPGYRIPGDILVKADVFTYVPDTPDISGTVPYTLNNKNENYESNQDESSVNQIQNSKEVDKSSQATDENINENFQSQSINSLNTEPYEGKNDNRTPEVEQNQNQQFPKDSQVQTDIINNNLSQKSITGLESISENKNIYLANFTGKIIPKTGIKVRLLPNNSVYYRSDNKLSYQQEIHFEAWTYSENMSSTIDKPDFRWYRVAGQNDWWVPGAYIEGEPQNAPPIPNEEGQSDETK